MSELANRCLELVSVPSVTGQEGALCERLLTWAISRFPRGKVQRWRNGFVLDPTGSSPKLGLFGHLDTVPPAADQPTEIRDGRVYGCGASDMKAGVAVMMAVLEARPESFWGVFYDQEEGPYADNGLEALLDLMPALELAIVLEPTANKIQAGCLGGIQARLHFPGKRAHSARPWEGENAVYGALPLLTRLSEQTRRAVDCDGLIFYEVMTVTQATTTSPRNAVPESFQVNLNVRFAPGRSLESALAELHAVVGESARVEVLDTAPSGAVTLNQPSLRSWLKTHRLAVEPKQAWTDVARLTGRGMAAVNFGPGDPAQAHQSREYVEIAAVHEGHRLLLELA